MIKFFMIPLSKNYRQTRFGLIILFIFLLRINAAAQTPMEIIENSGTRNFNQIVRLVEEYYADKDKGKGSGYKQFKRWEHFNRTRLDEHGDVVNVSLLGFEQAKLQRQRKAQGRIISSSPGNWKALGPDITELPNYNGRINCITV